jgi:glycosyltransferase involved in cell wall biosynthesis
VGAVLLIANYRLDGQHSMARSAELLATGLRSRGVDVEVLRPEALFGLIAKGSAGKWLSYLDKFILFPFRLMVRARRCRLVHIVDHSNAVYGLWLRGIKVIVTCNDLLALRSALGEIPEHRTGLTGRLLQKWIMAGLRRADHIACISEATKLDVLRLTKKSAGKVSRIYLGLDNLFETELLQRLNAVDSPPFVATYRSSGTRDPAPGLATVIAPGEPARPYILHVGGDTWYKNRHGVLSIYREVRKRLGGSAPNLVMVGPPIDTEIPGVQYLENVSNSNLVELYRNAELLLFPSLYEGFGWPVIEANACGCRAVVSEAPSLSEAGGMAASMISDPRNFQSGAERVIEVLGEETARREDRRKAGYRNASRFSRHEMVAEYLELYASIAPE